MNFTTILCAVENGVATITLNRPLSQPLAEHARQPLRQAKRAIDQGSELDPRGALAVELLAVEENLAQNAWRDRMAGFKGST